MSDALLAPVFHTREQLMALLMTREGDLRTTPYAVLLLALCLGEKSAVLELRRNQLSKEVIFDGGAPVDCHSNIATETLGRVLVSGGRLSEQDYAQALSAAASRGVPFEDILTERKLIAPSELYRLLQQNLGRKLLDPFSWKSGSFHISYDVPPVESSLRVRVPQLIVTGVAKVEPQEMVDATVAALEGRRLVLGEQPLFSGDDVRFTSEQQRVIDAARQNLLIGEFRATSGIAADDLNRHLYALLLIGAIATTDAALKRTPFLDLPSLEPFAPAPAAAPPPRAPLPAATASPAAPHFAFDTTVPPNTAAEMPPMFAEAPREVPREPQSAPPQAKPAMPAAAAEDVIATYMAYRRKDAFDLLGLPENAGGADITKTYVAFAEKYLPANFDAGAPDGLRDKAQEIFLAGARAYAELADPVRRNDLLKSRTLKRENAAAATQAAQAAAERTSRGGRRPSVIDPEDLCRQGRELADRGKLREALGQFEMAADCDSQNGTYAAEVAYCRFQLMISNAQSALKSLKNAIRIDPRSGIAYLYAGKVHATMGNRVEAESYLRKAMQLLPRDNRPAEAIKTLR